MKKLFMLLLAALIIIGCKNTDAQDEKAITLASGVRCLDHSVGTGEEAKKDDILSFHLIGWVIKDSTDLYSDWSTDTSRTKDQIVNSKSHNQPLQMQLGKSPLTPGMEEGILGMKPGGKRTIIVPAALAFGNEGVNEQIPPNSNIKIVVELVEVRKLVPVTQWRYDVKDIKTTPSGLKYVIMEKGKGDNAKAGDKVKVHYSGFFEKDGQKFDSSVERSEPIEFFLGQGRVIQGWEEGITLLNPGAKIKLIVPSSLAYGEQGRGSIPPNSNLIFDVELIEIIK